MAATDNLLRVADTACMYLERLDRMGHRPQNHEWIELTARVEALQYALGQILGVDKASHEVAHLMKMAAMERQWARDTGKRQRYLEG